MRAIKSLVCGVAATLAAAGCGGIASENGDAEYVLTFAGNLPEAHGYSQQYLEWAEAITERTDGRVAFENFFGDTLLGYNEILPGVRDGQADIGQVAPQVHPDTHPLSSIVGVPGSTDDLAAAVGTYWDLYEGFDPYRQEWEGSNLVPVIFQPTGTNVVGFPERLGGPEDIARQRVRASGSAVDVLDSLGATSAQMSSAETYEGVQRGVIDGYTSIELGGVASFSLPEVAEYTHDVGLGSGGVIVVFMNKEVFDSFPDDIQQVIEETTEEFAQKWFDMQTAIDEEACANVIEQGATLVEWTDEAKQDLADRAFDRARDSWIADAENAGAPGEDFWEAWRESQEQYDGSLGTYEGSVVACLQESR